MTDPRVRVRGIYATALTRWLLEGDVTVVQPSATIADRFDREFPTVPATVSLTTTEDREGIRLTGAPEAVEAVDDRLAALGDPGWAWAARLPRLAVCAGRVVDTSDHGAIVRTGTGRAGFLPFSETRTHVTVDDELIVQVSAPSPPWITGRRPVLTQHLFVAGEAVTIGEDIEGMIGGTEALTNTVDRLGIELPDGWGLRWHDAAEKMELTTLRDAIQTVLTRAETVKEARRAAGNPDEPTSLAQPVATRWCWFDRPHRFTLDDQRRAVCETMTGHHRIKVGEEEAGIAVDFVEALPGEPPAFDADATMTVFGPTRGDRVQIRHGKPDGSAYDLGPATVIDRVADGELVVERDIASGGQYDALDAVRERGDRAVSTFVEGRWWYPTVYRSAEDDRKGTYVNVGTPLELFPQRVRYLDLHVDVVKHADGSVDLVDEEELGAAVADGQVAEGVADRARAVAASIENVL